MPFPYNGRLDSWIMDNFPGDSSSNQMNTQHMHE
jgi:hypothetical protein